MGAALSLLLLYCVRVTGTGWRIWYGCRACRPAWPSGRGWCCWPRTGCNAQIARTVGVSRPTVIGWRGRYQGGGIAALEDQPRSGRPAEIDEIQVVVATLVNDGRRPGGWG